MLKAGTCLNHVYTLREEIGSGGGGIVYKAYHENLKKYVVVKQIKDVARDVLDSRAEADILKNLRNSYLPQVYDFLEIDGEIFTVIDYIEGDSLDKALEKEGRFKQKEVLKWAGQLLEALAYLHSQIPPIIHSDIKPSNIMLTPQGDICLIDFNVSLAFDEKMKISTGVSEGYSPPEQYQSYVMYREIIGQNIAEDNQRERKTEYVSQNENVVRGSSSKDGWKEADSYKKGRVTQALMGKGVDERSDIFSLGATLYHLLTGMCPAENFEKIVPLSACKVSVSEGFTLIIEKMMNLSPDKRFQNGKEALEAIRNIRKYDRVYKRYKSFCIAAGGGIAVLYVTSALLIGAGIRIMQKEKTNWYNRMIEQAVQQINEGKLEQAEQYIEAAMERVPERIDAYESELLRIYESGDYEKCVDYGRNIVNSPQYYIQNNVDQQKLGNILYIMGNAYYELEDYNNAHNCLNMAITYNSENSAYYCDLGIVLAKTGNMDKAMEILEQAAALGLAQESIYMIQGEIAYADNRSEEAIKLFKKAFQIIESDNLKRRCVMLCIKAYEQMGDSCLDDEISFLESVRNTVEMHNNMQLTEKLAEAYAKSGAYERALQTFSELKTQGYLSYQLMRNMAVLYQQTDQVKQAKEVLIEMEAQYPDRYETYKRLAFLEADIQQKKPNDDRNYNQMKEYYEKAQQLYQGQNDFDGEMQQLENMIHELAAGNWFD